MKPSLSSLLAATLSLALCPAPSSAAVSLFSGGWEAVRVSAPVSPAAQLPQVPTLGQAPSLALTPEAGLAPQGLAEPKAEPSAAETAVPESALAPLQAAAASLSAAAEPGGAPAQAALDGLFEAHVAAARDEYFGALAPGEEPGVFIPRPGARPLAAPGDAEMNDNVKASPRTNPERERAAIKLFERGGAKYDPATAAVSGPDLARYDQVQVQEALDRRGRPTGKHNVFVVKKGRSDRVIVVSSHNDKVDVGDGVIDNWTGTTMVTHLYQTMRDKDTEATIVFVTFAREEEGLLGSRFFLKSMTPAQRARIDSNVNLDTLAIKGGANNSWENGSDQVLLDAADAAVAQENKARGPQDQLHLSRMQLNGGDADSSSFRDQQPPIAGMTLFSGPEDLIFSTIHSENDNFGAFSFPLYKEAYHVTLALLNWLDIKPAKTAVPASA